MEIADEYQIRCNKARKLKEMGVLPYKDHFNKTHFTNEVREMDEKSFRSADEVLAAPNESVCIAEESSHLGITGKSYLQTFKIWKVNYKLHLSPMCWVRIL